MSIKPSENHGKVRVTIVLGTHLSVLGGAELAVIEYAERVDKNKIDLTILQTDQGKRDDVFFQSRLDGVRVLTLKGIKERFNFLIRNRALFVVFTMVLQPILMAIGSRTFNRKVLNQVRGTDVFYMFQNELQGYLKGFSGKVIGHNGMWDIKPSSLSFKLVCAHLIWRRIDGFRLFSFNRKYEKMLNKNYNLILDNGVDTSVLYPVFNDSQRTRILFVGRLTYGKGFDLLIEALKLLPENENIDVHIAGSGPLENLLKTVNMKNVVYHGKIFGEDFFRLFRESDIFILMSRWEPYGRVIREALSCGLMCILSERFRNDLKDFEQYGIIKYTSDDPEEIANTILSSINDLPMVRNVKGEVHDKVKALYDLDSITNRLFNFFAEISEQQHEN